MKKNNLTCILIIIPFIITFSCKNNSEKQPELKWSEEWQGRIYPPEYEIVTDSTSGAKLISSPQTRQKTSTFISTGIVGSATSRACFLLQTEMAEQSFSGIFPKQVNSFVSVLETKTKATHLALSITIRMMCI